MIASKRRSMLPSDRTGIKYWTIVSSFQNILTTIGHYQGFFHPLHFEIAKFMIDFTPGDEIYSIIHLSFILS